MFNNKKNEDHEGLKQAIDAALLELAMTKPNSDEYAATLDKIERLFKLQAPKPEPRKLATPDAIISAAASLAGIVMIINAEHVGVITSKALGFVVKPKL